MLHEADHVEENVLEHQDGMVVGSENLQVDLNNEGLYGNYFNYPTIFKY